MEQIYYTQCPMGYGLGASNGFQVKRISAGYPLNSDFRHLGLRAYPAGGRTLAPSTLRYRRLDGIAELAWLTPRKFEYETERGLWGRPGGHFAHGVRFDLNTLTEFDYWVAGLQDASGWVRTDPVPSLGQVPPPLAFTAEHLVRRPLFEEVSPWASGVERLVLARAFAAIALAVRESRTVFLIDHQERLCEHVGLLTFAFPGSLRKDLTFSTFHDRPEELPGFRIQGTTPAVRPNRAAILAQGMIVDFVSGLSEPLIHPPAWACLLADWFTNRTAQDAQAWDTVNQLSRRVSMSWEESALDALFSYPSDTQPTAATPVEALEWQRLAERTRWAGRQGEANAWVRAHPPGWWSFAFTQDEQREALSAQLAMPESWLPAGWTTAWGELVANAWRDTSQECRESATLELLRNVPKAQSGSFLRSLIARLPDPEARSLVRRVQTEMQPDDATLLPLQAEGAVKTYLDRGTTDALVALIRRARKIPGSLSEVLDVFSQEASRATGGVERVGNILSQLFLNHVEAWTWALRRGDEAGLWLAPSIRPVLAIPGNRDAWRLLRDRTEHADLPRLARVFLSVAAASGLPDDAFLWGVEKLLLTLPLERRPDDSSWPGIYLDRTPSDFDLINAVYRSKGEGHELREWIKSAVGQGALSESQRERVDRLQTLVRALRGGIAAQIEACSLERVHKRDHGRMLGLILARTRDDPGRVLEALGRCWPGLGDSDGEILAKAGTELARWPSLASQLAHPSLWLDQVRWVIERLSGTGPIAESELAAETLAASTRACNDEGLIWRLRQWIFDQESAWMMLRADVRQSLVSVPVDQAGEVVRLWDRNIDKGRQSSRFWELILNVADGRRLAEIASVAADELRTVGDLAWWAAGDLGEGLADLRERFARTVVMRPLPTAKRPGDPLGAIQAWLRGPRKARAPVDLVPLDGRPEIQDLVLSEPGKARWRCVEALTKLHNPRLASRDRGWEIFHWRTHLPLGKLGAEDRLAFLAWTICAIGDPTHVQLEPLAKWLSDLGFDQANGLEDWVELTESQQLSPDERDARDELVGLLKRELSILRREARERQSANEARPFQAGELIE